MNRAAGTPHDTVMPSRPLAGPASRPAAPGGRRAGPARHPGGAARPLSGPVLRRAAAPWRWLAERTLRGRLIAGLLMLLALACAVAGGATYLAANRFLLIQLDDQLQASARLYAAACEHHGGFEPGGVPGGTGPGSPGGGPGNPGGGPGSPGCGNFTGQAENTLDVSLSNGLITSQTLVNGECNLTAAEKTALAGLPGRRPAAHRGSALAGRWLPADRHARPRRQCTRHRRTDGRHGSNPAQHRDH